LAFIPPYLLSRYTEIYGKNYTKLHLSFKTPFVLLENFFFPEAVRHDSAIHMQSMILVIFCVIAVVGLIHIVFRKPDTDRKFNIFCAASFLGLTAFCVVASQFSYLGLSVTGSCPERYGTVFILFVAFWMPLIIWEISRQILSACRLPEKFIGGVSILAASVANIILVSHILHHIELPKIKVEPELVTLAQMARDQNAQIVIAGDNSKWTADYWAPWPLLFHSLAEGGSLKNAIIPITYRCSAIIAQIDAALPGANNHEPFRALCIGASAAECKRTTAQCGFFHFSDVPKTLNEMPYTFHGQTLTVSTLEFAPADKGKFGSLIPMVTVNKPAEITPANTLHIPATSEPFITTSGPFLRLLPGDYRVTLNCTAHGNFKNDDVLADIAVTFPEKNMIFRKMSFRGADGLLKKSFSFNVPDFKFFTPRVQFLLTTTGKATLDCDEFRLIPL
jgi:hypothetical protein